MNLDDWLRTTAPPPAAPPAEPPAEMSAAPPAEPSVAPPAARPVTPPAARSAAAPSPSRPAPAARPANPPAPRTFTPPPSAPPGPPAVAPAPVPVAVDDAPPVLRSDEPPFNVLDVTPATAVVRAGLRALDRARTPDTRASARVVGHEPGGRSFPVPPPDRLDSARSKVLDAIRRDAVWLDAHGASGHPQVSRVVARVDMLSRLLQDLEAAEAGAKETSR